MENAANALTIAGAVLLAIMVIAIGVYNYDKIRSTADVYSEHFDSIELEKYNSRFTTFIGRRDITIQEIISATSFAQEKNVGTNIYVDNTNITGYTDKQKMDFLTANISQYVQAPNGPLLAKNWFTCDLINYDSYGQVSEVRFTKN